MKNNQLYFKIGIYLAAGIFAAGGFFWLVNDNIKQMDKIEIKTDKNIENIQATQLDVIGLTKDIAYIKEKVDKNTEVQQQILKEIRQIK